MRTLGFFREMNPRRPDVFRESLVEAVRTSPGRYEDEVVGFLDSGIPLVDIMESTSDVIGGEVRISGGSSVLTDGIWVWRQDLPYYVRTYHLELNEEFMAHAIELNFVVPEQGQSDLVSLAELVLRDVLDMS